jgi:ABC-2 type transport system permease protein
MFTFRYLVLQLRMKSLLQIEALAEMLGFPILRNPVTYLILFIFPAIFLFLYSLLGGVKLGEHVLFGSLVGFTMNSGIISLPQKVVEYKVKRLQDMFVASPANEVIYLFGIGLSRLLLACPGCLLFLAILLTKHFVPLSALPVIIVILLASWACGCAIGFTLATYVTNPPQISALANVLGVFLLLLPPVMYPLQLIPPHWRLVTLFLPSVSAAHLLKTYAGISTGSTYTVPVAWLPLLVYLALGFVVVINKSRWRET